jgi:uncharacterized YceG family protein
MGRLHLVILAVALTAAVPTSTAAPPPGSLVLRISFPEGYTAAEMTQRVAKVRQIAIRKRHVTPVLTARTYAAAVAKARAPRAFRAFMQTASLEGFLFPSLYFFGASTEASQIVSLQLEAFTSRWKQLNLARASALGFNRYQVLIIASMVEREAALRTERPLVAAVIFNRLAQDMPLGIDATLRYGLGIAGTSSLTQRQLRNPTPYNTRLHKGLPPTPISNPGLASIDAAARPAKVDYLWYVRIPNTQRHFFTDDYAEFCKKVVAWGYGKC